VAQYWLETADCYITWQLLCLPDEGISNHILIMHIAQGDIFKDNTFKLNDEK